MKPVNKVALVGASGMAAILLLAVASWVSAVAAKYTDGDRISVSTQDARLRQILWQPPTAVPGAINTQADEYEPRLSVDGSLLVFVRGKPGANAELFSSRWSPEGWSTPSPLSEINTEHDELGPELSPDGLCLYFYSDRAGGLGGYDLWVSRTVESGWGAPTNLGAAVNTEHHEYGPAVTPDGKKIYFSSNRSRPGEAAPQRDPWAATVRETRDRHDYDLYAAAVKDGAAGDAEAVRELNTGADEGAPAISPVGDFLYFASNRPGGIGGFDLLRSRLTASGYGRPENLGTQVNSIANDLDPALSADGFRLHFSSDRPRGDVEVEQDQAAGTPRDADAPADYGLWTTSSREVFVERDASAAWRAAAYLWNLLWPWIGLLVLAPLFAYLMWRLFNDKQFAARFRKLSLLTQCVLVSLAIHLLLASLLTIWKVGAQVGEFLRQGGGTRVVLASSGVAGDVAGQLRGGFESAAEIPILETQRIELPAMTVEAPVLQSRDPGNAARELAAASLGEAAETLIQTRLSEISQETPAETASTPPRVPEPLPGERTSEVTAPVIEAAALDRGTRAPSTVIGKIDVPRTQVAPAASAPQGVEAWQPLPADVAPASSGTRPALTPLVQAEQANSTVAAIPAAPQAAAPIAETGTPGVQVAAGSERATLPALDASPATRADVQVPGRSTDATAIAPMEVGIASADSVSTAIRPPFTSASVVPSRPDGVGAERLPSISAPKIASGSDSGATNPELSTIPAPGSDRAPLAELLAVPSSVESARVAPPAANSVLAPAAVGVVSESDVRTDPMPRIGGSKPVAVSIGESAGAARIPADQSASQPVENFAQRSPEVRQEVLDRMGGSKETEKAVGAALDWFKAHQQADGRWSGKHFDDGCGKCANAAEIDSDTAMTGLVVQCFLGAGHTHVANGPYRDSVNRALTWIVSRQAPNGDLRRSETMYSHNVGTVALCEAYAMTRDAKMQDAARRAVSFMLDPRSVTGLREANPQDGDTSVLGWQVMAMASARRCGFVVPQAAFDAVKEWLDYVAVPRSPGRYAYSRGERPNAAMTAEAMFVRQLLGAPRTEVRMQDSARFVLETPPTWRDGAPTYYWYYATLALFEHQGEAWRQWNERVVAQLVESQRQDGPAAGSWEPQDYWSRLGGRIYQTAICTLCLEAYYRYRPAGEPLPLPLPLPDRGTDIR